MKKLLILFFILFSFPCFAQVYSQSQKIVALDRTSGAQFGSAVAMCGNYAVVGAYTETDDTFGLNTLSFAGSAYIFEKNTNGNWIQKQKLVPSDRAASDYFGASVAIDSNRLVIGAYEKNAIGATTYTHAGAVYIFERNSNGVWNEIQKLVAADTSTKSHFGYTVSVSGNYIVAGTPLESEDTTASNTLANAGAAYVFKRDAGGNWSQEKKLVAFDRAATDFFGISVSISDSTIFVGANREDEDSLGLNTINESGSVYVYEKNTNGQWYHSQKITAQDRGVIDRFGSCVSISGNKAVIGVFLEDENSTGTSTMNNAGAAYIFERNTNNKWTQKQKIIASDRAPNDYFGIAAQIDGDRIIVGADQESEDESGGNTISFSGSAYIFERDINGNWNQKQKIVASDRAAIDLFGHNVAVSDSSFIVGAYAEDEDANGGNSLNGSGSAYFFEPTMSTGTAFLDTENKISVYPNPNSGTFFIHTNKNAAEISIINIYGQLVYSTKSTDKTVYIDMELPKGIYFVAVTTSEKSEVKKIIVE